MRRVAVFVVLLVVAALAVPAGAEVNPERPIKGDLVGTAQVDLDNGDTGTEVAGPMSHLGLTSAELFHKVTGFGVEGETLVAGDATFTAANGDSISGPYVGAITAPTGTLYVDLSEGTGRFAAAAGTLTIEVLLVDFSDFPVVGLEMSLTGTISY